MTPECVVTLSVVGALILLSIGYCHIGLRERLLVKATYKL
jgi:hypothetical protein